MNDRGESSSRLPFLLGSLLLVALVFATFSPLATSQFVHWDDRTTIAANPSLSPVTLKSVLSFWSPANPQGDLYVPVTYTLWAALAAISPRHPPDAEGYTLSPAVFHLANVAMHALAAIVVWRILRRLVKQDVAAIFGAAIFAVHPVQVETIGWISGGKDVLSGLLGLISILMYLRSLDGSHGRASYFVATLAFIGATLAKPQAVAIPVVAFAIDAILARRKPASAIKSLAIWFAWCVPVILVGQHVQSAQLLDSPVWFRPIVALDALAFYFGKILWPVGLVLDYSRSPGWLIESVDRFWTWMVPVAAAIVCFKLRHRARWALASFAVFVGALLPVLGLVRFDFQMFSTVADHYLYVAMLGVAMCVAWLLKRPRRYSIAFASVVVGICAILSFRQCSVWHDTLALFEHNYDLNPLSMASADVLGRYWEDHGDPERAIGLLAENVRLHPDVALAHFTYANLLQDRGLLAQAIPEYQAAIDRDASKPEYYRNFGVALGKSGRPDLALKAFQLGIKQAPDSVQNYDNYLNAGVALANLNRLDEAKAYLRRAIELDPSRPDARRALEMLWK